GAVKAANVRRERPAPGDVILLLGGRTGRDGIGGATGASKEHDESSLETCGSEVQKGNAPEERKLQRLFRRPEVTRLIKKSNDFGAGGVSVAIGELADGLDIWLDRVPVKYSGLNSTELAISESQERMAVVVEGRDEAEFRSYCRQENVEVTHVAEVTDTGRMRMYNGGRMVVDLERGFIDSAGARHHAEAEISAVPEKDPFLPEKSDKALKDRILDLIRRPDVCSQKGLIEMFDSTVGRSTVLMPLGGRLQATEAQVSVQKLPTDGYTDTASMMAWGFDPYLSEWSPYHGAAYAVVDACTKVAAAGGDASRMRFSYQEYFERMGAPSTWGKPLAALLGALKMQEALGLPAIGGKDSMSGSFEDRLHVPPTLVAIGITTVKASEVISPEFKEEGHGIWLLEHKPLGNHMPDTEALLRNWKLVKDEVHSGNVVAAFAAGAGGVAEAVCKMAFGNGLGAEVETGEGKLLCIAPGSIVMEAVGDVPGAVRIGTVKKGTINLNGVSFSTSSLLAANEEPWSRIYPIKSRPDFDGVPALRSGRNMSVRYRGARIEHPLVYLPVFPGTNCDYDTAKAFRAAGALTRFGVFCNQSEEDIRRSLKDMAAALAECQILALSGGFSAGDEPDGSGKFIADILCNKEISAAIRKLLERGGLILGICNGFQALVKSGLLPYGEAVSEDSPTLFRNDVGRHVSRVVTTRVASLCSPWLRGFSLGQEHTIAISHGEGKFMVRKDLAEKLLRDGQVAFQYADADGGATMQSPDNPNGSYCAIEGIVSANGQILGKMGHSERWEQGLLKNIPGDKRQPIFENAVNYFRGE
nr:phosphoribosylformylglycinamidine synthase subunit PurQ [Bacteroidales bacterium]